MNRLKNCRFLSISFAAQKYTNTITSSNQSTQKIAIEFLWRLRNLCYSIPDEMPSIEEWGKTSGVGIIFSSLWRNLGSYIENFESKTLQSKHYYSVYVSSGFIHILESLSEIERFAPLNFLPTLAAISDNICHEGWSDTSNLEIYADWLEENGRKDRATHCRRMSEIILKLKPFNELGRGISKDIGLEFTWGFLHHHSSIVNF